MSLLDNHLHTAPGAPAEPREPTESPGSTGPTESAPTRVCAVDALTPGRGVAALVGGRQVAVFLVDGAVYAVDHFDPCSRANVLARGLVGHDGDEPYVASPIRKERFSLATGRCLDDPGVAVSVHRATVVDGLVYVACGVTSA